MNTSLKLIDVLREIEEEGRADVSKIELLSYEEQELIWELQENNRVKEALLYLESIDADKEWEVFKEKINTKKRPVIINWKTIFQYAAVLVTLLSIAFVFKYKTTPEAKVVIPDDAIQLVLENGDSNQLFSRL